MSEWKEVRLGDYIEFNPYRKLRKGDKAKKITMDMLIPYSKQIYDYIVEPYNGGTKFQNGDTIMARITPCLENGKHAYINILDKDEIAYGSTEYIVLCGKADVTDNEFVYYFSHSPIFKNTAIKSMVGSSGRQRAQTDVLKELIVNVPISISDQKEIAGILSSLDAKIETNNKLNEKLEEMAQAIFKSWFVDFEPFKDKPFHETEIGYIPQIFESGVLGDLCTFKRGKGLLSKDAIFGNVPVIAGGMKPACYHNIANTKAPVVTVSGSGANAGYTQIHNVDVWASDCSFIDSNCENLYYVYCFLSRRPKLLRHSQTGAAQPHVKPADIHRFQVVIPTKDVINEFQQIVKPLFDRIGMNKKENDRLASLRDTLLPRLMSGELIV